MTDRDRLLPEGSWSPGLTDAIRALREAADRPPGPRDLPPPSTFPITPAARAALAYSKMPAVSRKRKRDLTHGTDA